ncbi:hypothetical protein [Dyella sp. 2RAB6]|uniref:hypothetical protein n=1 Tax=Dyella sp. 2RAB6 TaxID=3232992 RepID=UPI003F93463D
MNHEQQSAGGFSAGDMTDAAASGFRDGQASAANSNSLLTRPDWLYRGLAKIAATGEQLPPDATDHAIVYDPATGLMEAINAPGFDKDLSHDAAVTAATPISSASDRLDNALFTLHARLETLSAKLTPVLHAQAPQSEKTANDTPASDVGLVRQFDDATSRVLQAVRGIDDLIERAAV